MSAGRSFFLLALLLAGTACARSSAQGTKSPPCGPSLSRAELIQIAEKAVDAIGGDPASLTEDHQIQVRERGCDYLLTAIPHGTVAREPISMRISRRGEVMSFPWCCPLGHCPDLCPTTPDQ